MANIVNITFDVNGNDKVKSILKEMQECLDKFEALKAQLANEQITIQAACQ